jgi:hypothetical protein
MLKSSETIKNKLPIRDINELSYLVYNGVPYETVIIGSRVDWEVEATDRVYELLRLYAGDPPVNILSYVGVLRRLRSEMIGRRGPMRTNRERG